MCRGERVTTIEEIISEGGVRPSSSTRNKILITPVKVRHVRGYSGTATAVGIEGERKGCIMVWYGKTGQWEPVTNFNLAK